MQQDHKDNKKVPSKESDSNKSEVSAAKKGKMQKELSKTIVQTNYRKQRGRFNFFGINPIVFTITISLAAIFFLSFFQAGSITPKLSLGELTRGLNNNEFAQIVIQDDGSVVAKEKSYLYTTDEEFPDLSADENLSIISVEEQNLEETSFDNLVVLLEPQSLAERVRSVFNGEDVSQIEEIIIDDSFILARVTNGDKAYLLRDFTPEQFNTALDDAGINLDEIGVLSAELKVLGKEASSDSVLTRIANEQSRELITVDGVQLLRIDPEEVTAYLVDWTPSIYTFVEVLQREGFSLDQENFEIISEKVSGGITLDTILTVLTIAGFVFLGFIIFRSAQASGMGLMQFGRSRAKMFFGRKTDASFADVAGIDEAKEELLEIVDFLKEPGKYVKMGARIPKGVLMVGPPGTGKTLLARAIAGEAKVPFFHTSGSEFEEMLVGAGASRVRDLFDKAKKAAPSLIFIDEIDAVARKRGTRMQSGSTEQTLNQILVEMDGFEKNMNVIVIAATNRPDVLDTAILRPGRFDRQVRIELPDKDGRFEILKLHSKNKQFDSSADLEQLAKRTVGFSGADLENILNEAAIIAAKNKKTKISMEELDEAVSKVVLGPAKKSRKRTDDELNLVAYHEAGHALVAKKTPGAVPVDKISIISRGGAGGVTMFTPEKDENIVSQKRLIADITVSLGGRAAEEIVLDDISTGASNDIEKATKVARQMIQKFGMSAKLGLVKYDYGVNSAAIGYSYDDYGHSEKTAEMIDEEVRAIVETAYTHAKDILEKNREKLDEIAQILLEKEVLDREDFDKLF